MTYAGFWKRTAAYIIDTFIYGLASYIIAFVLGIVLALATGIDPDKLSAAENVLFSLGSMLFSLTCYLVYYVWAESSAWQATIGKKIMGLKVTDIYGRRVSFWRSLGRNIGMIVSSLILLIGYLMCFWTAKKQCLHDKMAGCLVVDETPNEKKGCMLCVIIAWLVALIVFMGIIVFVAIPQSKVMQRARQAQTQVNQRITEMEQLQQRLRQEVDKIDFENIQTND
jgi:uncharacterized RDD family membrane protein YckC